MPSCTSWTARTGNWWFLPWHRGYLGWFEKTIRELSGNPSFALPFWDWTAQPSVPTPFFSGLLDPHDATYIETFDAFKVSIGPSLGAFWSGLSAEQANQLKSRGFLKAGDLVSEIAFHFALRASARRLTATAPDLNNVTRAVVALPRINAVLAQPDFSSFASGKTSNHAAEGPHGGLESGPHDNVHGNVGGMMGAYLSPVDPLFFLHHANLDRLWTIWSATQQQAGRPTLPAGQDLQLWSAEPFLFFSDEKGKPVTLKQAGDYRSTSVFEYEYEPGSASSIAPVVAALPSKVFKGVVTSTAMVLGQSATARTTVSANVVDAAETPDARALSAEVTIDPAAGPEDARFLVFLNPPAGTSTLGPEDPSFAGAVQFFGGTRHHQGPTTFTVPLAPALQALRRANAFNSSDPLRIEVVPDAQGAARRPLSATLVGFTVKSF